jgi:hypothetical protein
MESHIQWLHKKYDGINTSEIGQQLEKIKKTHQNEMKELVEMEWLVTNLWTKKLREAEELNKTEKWVNNRIELADTLIKKYSYLSKSLSNKIRNIEDWMKKLQWDIKSLDTKVKEISEKWAYVSERTAWHTQDAMQYGNLAVKFWTLYSVLNATLENFMLDEYGGEILNITKWVLSQEFEKIRENWKRSRDMVIWDIYRQIQKRIEWWGVKLNEFHLWRLKYLLENEHLIKPEKEIPEWDREMRVALNVVSAVELFLRKWENWVDVEIIDGKEVWITVVDKLMDKHFDVERNLIDTKKDL